MLTTSVRMCKAMYWFKHHSILILNAMVGNWDCILPGVVKTWLNALIPRDCHWPLGSHQTQNTESHKRARKSVNQVTAGWHKQPHIIFYTEITGPWLCGKGKVWIMWMQVPKSSHNQPYIILVTEVTGPWLCGAQTSTVSHCIVDFFVVETRKPRTKNFPVLFKKQNDERWWTCDSWCVHAWVEGKHMSCTFGHLLFSPEQTICVCL